MKLIVTLMAVGLVCLGVDNYRIHKELKATLKSEAIGCLWQYQAGDLIENLVKSNNSLQRDLGDLNDRVFSLEHQRSHDGMPLFIRPEPPTTLAVALVGAELAAQ